MAAVGKRRRSFLARWRCGPAGNGRFRTIHSSAGSSKLRILRRNLASFHRGAVPGRTAGLAARRIRMAKINGGVVFLGSLLAAVQASGQMLPNMTPFPNGSGAVATFVPGGAHIDLT